MAERTIVDTAAPTVVHRERRSVGARLAVVGRALLAGAFLALAVPPAGWWPLAFVGVAIWDRLLADAPAPARALRTFVVVATWLFPTTLWMADLTLPGYVVAGIGYSLYFAVAAVAVPPHAPARWVALPGVVALAELAKWTTPFEGVPLANLALTQAGSCAPPCTQVDSPLVNGARLGGALLVVALVVLGGIALSAAWERRWRAAAVATAVVVALTVGGVVAPAGQDVGSMRIALVQGGGRQRTGLGNDDAAGVFRRHVEATRSGVTTPVDLIVWPENTVALEGTLEQNRLELDELRELAREKGAPILAGVTEGFDSTFANAAIVIEPDGTIGDRYDKVRRVPFGEWVPLRGLIQTIAPNSGIPARDAIAGTGPAVVDVGGVPVGVGISWEAYFDDRARDAAQSGAQVLVNPTNGASYWLTQVQTQQIASNRLRAVETGRWLGEAAPTGLSALVAPNGALLARSDVGEQRVIEAPVTRRDGTTPAVRWGRWAMFLAAVAAVVAGWWMERRARRTAGPPSATDAADDGHRAPAGAHSSVPIGG